MSRRGSSGDTGLLATSTSGEADVPGVLAACAPFFSGGLEIGSGVCGGVLIPAFWRIAWSINMCLF